MLGFLIIAFFIIALYIVGYVCFAVFFKKSNLKIGLLIGFAMPFVLIAVSVVCLLLINI